MQFLLNNDKVELTGLDPNESLLSFLRTRMGLTGTKEGCASGDCGACTVVVVNEAQGEPRYQAINSCIALMPQVVGKHVMTVESLSDGGFLHPVQQALVDFHGSQCGFCTPGIVMSLFALYQHNRQPSREQVLDALSGNLCRCTGYRPIVDSALAWDRYPAPLEQYWQPSAMDADSGAIPTLPGCDLPGTEDELAALLAQSPQAKLLAGGTDLGLDVTQQYRSLTPLIALTRIESLRQLSVEEDVVRIGSMASYRDLEPLFAVEYPAFATLLRRLGSRQIRNLGTLGGNVTNASPIGDTPPVLLALDAALELASLQGRRELSARDFFLAYRQTALQPGEYLRSIRLPRLGTDDVLKIYKISKRFEDDISAVLGAFWFNIRDGVVVDVRLGFGGMAEIPKRAAAAEEALRGAPLSECRFEDAAKRLAEDFTPLSDVRASAEYRLKVARNLLLKCWIELSDPRTQTQIETQVTTHA